MIATNGPQSLFLRAQLSKAAKLGHLNFSRATQSALATLYKQDRTLTLLFNKQIKDYHFNDYNFGDALITFLPDHPTIQVSYITVPFSLQFLIFDDAQSQSLIRTAHQDLYSRKLATPGSKFKCALPDVESPNEFQGLLADVFTELWTRQCPVLLVLLVRADYQVALTQIQELEKVSAELGLAVEKGLPYTDDIKKMNRDRNKDTIYL